MLFSRGHGQTVKKQTSGNSTPQIANKSTLEDGVYRCSSPTRHSDCAIWGPLVAASHTICRGICSLSALNFWFWCVFTTHHVIHARWLPNAHFQDKMTTAVCHSFLFQRPFSLLFAQGWYHGSIWSLLPRKIDMKLKYDSYSESLVLTPILRKNTPSIDGDIALYVLYSTIQAYTTPCGLYLSGLQRGLL